MDHFAGLDVSVKETSVCIVDDTGKIVREVKVASEPDALLAVLTNPHYHFKRIGLEAGPLSQWLFSALAQDNSPPLDGRDWRCNRRCRGRPHVASRSPSRRGCPPAFARIIADLNRSDAAKSSNSKSSLRAFFASSMS